MTGDDTFKHDSIGGKPAVPIEELEELADEWEDGVEFAESHKEICSNEAITVAKNHIQDLRELIE